MINPNEIALEHGIGKTQGDEFRMPPEIKGHLHVTGEAVVAGDICSYKEKDLIKKAKKTVTGDLQRLTSIPGVFSSITVSAPATNKLFKPNYILKVSDTEFMWFYAQLETASARTVYMVPVTVKNDGTYQFGTAQRVLNIPVMVSSNVPTRVVDLVALKLTDTTFVVVMNHANTYSTTNYETDYIVSGFEYKDKEVTTYATQRVTATNMSISDATANRHVRNFVTTLIRMTDVVAMALVQHHGSENFGFPDVHLRIAYTPVTGLVVEYKGNLPLPATAPKAMAHYVYKTPGGVTKVIGYANKSTAPTDAPTLYTLNIIDDTVTLGGSVNFMSLFNNALGAPILPVGISAVTNQDFYILPTDEEHKYLLFYRGGNATDQSLYPYGWYYAVVWYQNSSFEVLSEPQKIDSVLGITTTNSTSGYRPIYVGKNTYVIIDSTTNPAKLRVVRLSSTYKLQGWNGAIDYPAQTNSGMDMHMVFKDGNRIRTMNSYQNGTMYLAEFVLGDDLSLALHAGQTVTTDKPEYIAGQPGQPGQPVKYISKGLTGDVFSGLLPGSRYYADENHKLTNKYTPNFLGIAISPTELLLLKSNQEGRV